MNRTEQLLDRAMALIDSMEQRLRVRLRNDTILMPEDRSVLLECDTLKSAVCREVTMPRLIKHEREGTPATTC
jgi:hypothetical protein